MPRISQTPELASTNDLDEIPIVDKSDLTGGASGTTKRIKIATLASAVGGLGPADDLTIVGNDTGGTAAPTPISLDVLRFKRNGATVSERAAPFDNLAQLRAHLVAAGVITGAVYRVIAHTVLGDGGGGVYRGLPAGSYTDDNGDLITPNGGSHATAVIRERAYLTRPEDFGATRSYPTDKSTQMQAALASSRALRLLPGKTEKYSAAGLNVTGLKSVFGDHAELVATANDDVFFADTDGNANVYSKTIEKLFLNGASFTGVKGYSGKATRLTWDKVVCYRVDTPFELTGGALQVNVRDCAAIEFDGVGMLVRQGSNLFHCETFEFTTGHVGLIVRDNPSAPTAVGLNSARWISCVWQNLDLAHFIDGSVGTADIDRTVFEGCHFEGNATLAKVTANYPFNVDTDAYTINAADACSVIVKTAKATYRDCFCGHAGAGSGKSQGPFLRAIDGAVVEFESCNGTGARDAPLFIADSASYVVVHGLANLTGQNTVRGDYSDAFPRACSAWSAVEQPPKVQICEFVNNAHDAPQDPWVPDLSTGSPLSNGEEWDDEFGWVSYAQLDTTTGSTGANNGRILFKAASGAVAVDDYCAVTFLARVESGSSDVEFYTPDGGGVTANATLTDQWQRISLALQYTNTTGDRRLYFYPEDTTGPKIYITAVASVQSAELRSLTPIIQGWCTPRLTHNPAIAQTHASAITVDFAQSANQSVTLTGNVALTFTAPEKPGLVKLAVVQDGSGGHAPTWPATVRAPGSAIDIATAAASITIVLLYWDGTNYHLISSSPGVAGSVVTNLV